MIFKGTQNGFAVIVGIILSTLIIAFSVNLLEVTVVARNNFKRAQEGSKNILDQKNLKTKAEGLARNHEVVNSELAQWENYFAYISINGGTQSEETLVWRTTGCPIPNDDLANDLGTPADLESERLTRLDESNQIAERENLAQICANFASDEELNNAYFVYPSPLTTKHAPYFGLDCNTDKIAKKVDETVVNPLDHPCYWGRLEANKFASIPINQLGKNLAAPENRFQTLTLRLRPACPNRQAWCSEEERIEQLSSKGYGYNTQDLRNGVDSSRNLAFWELKVDSDEGIRSFGVSRGRREDIERALLRAFCSNVKLCRASNNSELTEQLLVTQVPSVLSISNLGKLAFGGKVTRDLQTDELILDQNLQQTSIFDLEIYPKYAEADLELYLQNISYNADLEYQLISDQPLPRFFYKK